MLNTRLFLVLLLLLAMGCGGVPQSQLDTAQKAVDAALAAWKKGEKPANFTDEAVKSSKLTDYQILRTEADREKLIRSFVKLTLVDRKGKSSTIEVAYQVKLDPTPSIARDPYF